MRTGGFTSITGLAVAGQGCLQSRQLEILWLVTVQPPRIVELGVELDGGGDVEQLAQGLGAAAPQPGHEQQVFAHPFGPSPIRPGAQGLQIAEEVR